MNMLQRKRMQYHQWRIYHHKKAINKMFGHQPKRYNKLRNWLLKWTIGVCIVTIYILTLIPGRIMMWATKQLQKDRGL